MSINKITTAFALAITGLSPFMPLAAHAETGAALTGNMGIGMSGTDSAAVNTNIDGNATLKAEPIVITRATINGSLTASSGAPSEATTSEDLRTQAAALVSEDARVSSVVLSNTKVSLSYQEPAKLFGFINVNVPVEVSVAANGSTSVNYPWYSFLLSSDQAGLAVRAQAAVSNVLPARTNASVKLSSADEAHILSSLHEVMRSEANGSVRTTTSVQ